MTSSSSSVAVANLDDERSIREGEAAAEQYNRLRDEARAQVLPMARGLLAAKRKYLATQAFGDWLETSPYQKIGKDDRAALIKIGENEELAVQFIRTTSLISPELIWAAIKASLPGSTPTSSTPTSDDPNSPNPPSALEPVVPIGESGPPSGPSLPASSAPSSDDLKSASSSHRANSTSNPPPTTELLGSSRPLPAGVSPAVLYTPGSFFSSVETSGTESKPTDHGGFATRAAEFHGIFRDATTRETLACIHRGKHGPAIWGLMTQARDAGLLVENDRSLHTASLWLLCPSLPHPGKYDLENPEHLAQVQNYFLPAMLAHRDQILANPERVTDIVNEYVSLRDAAEKNRTEADRQLAWRQDISGVLWEITRLGQRYDSEYGSFWRQWPIPDPDRLKRAVKFLSSLIPVDEEKTD
jgi:hypothetical protein